MSASDVGHGRACLCQGCTESRLAAEANTRRIVARPENPFAPQHDHVMVVSVTSAVAPRRGAQ